MKRRGRRITVLSAGAILIFGPLLLGCGQQVDEKQPRPTPKVDKEAGETGLLLSLACDPVAKQEIARKKGSTVTVKVRRADGTPVVGKVIQLSVETGTAAGRVGGPTAPQSAEGVLGRPRKAPTYEVITGEDGNGKVSIPIGSLRFATAIRARVDGKEAACVLN